MKLSATVSAFLVLLVVTALVGVAFSAIDFNTDVSTVNETRLPVVYDGDGFTYANGFSFRHPRGWTATGQGETIVLSHPMDSDDPEAPVYNFTLDFQQVDADSPIDPADYVGDTGDLTITEASGTTLASARQVETTPDNTVNIAQATRLTDDNVIVQVANTAPIALEDWNEIDDDLYLTLDSISVAEDFAVVQDALAFTLPDTWSLQDSSQTSFVATYNTESPDAPVTFIEAFVMPSEQVISYFQGRGLPLPPAATLDTPPNELIDLYAEFEDPNLTLFEEPHEVTYFGLDGKAVGLSAQGLAELRIVILDGGDGYNVSILEVVNGDTYASREADFEAILDSVTYTTPDASLFE